MNNINLSSNPRSQDDSIDVKKIIYLVLRQWYWFLLFAALGLGGAYLYNKLTKPTYSVSSSILIPEKSSGLDMNELFEGALDQNNTNIYNQIEILKSSFTINQTLVNLNWRTNWYRKDLLIWKGIYKREPFDVQEPTGYVNPAGLKIYITPLSKSDYKIVVDGVIKNGGVSTEVKFESKGAFGSPFQNDFMNFTLLNKMYQADDISGEYYFTFNDLKKTTLSYQKRLSATVKDKNSDIVLCTIQGEEPAREGDFLNELVKVYIDQKMQIQNEAQRRSLDFINEQLTGISDSLDQAGTKFTEFRSSNKIIDLGAEGKLVMDNLKEIESERAKSQIQLDYFNNVLSYLEKSGDLTKIVSPSVVGIEDVSLNALVLKLGELFNRRQVLSFTAKANNPTLIMLDKELAQTRNRLNENLRNLISNATKSINSLKERQASISFQLNKLPAKEQQMINIQRQFTLTNEIYTFLLQKRAETNIALASSISDVRIIEAASPETAVSLGLSKEKVYTTGFLFSLAFPIAIVLLVNFLDNRIRTQEDIENNTQLPIVGNIMHSQFATELSVYNNPKSSIAESFRDLRTNLEFMLSQASSKVISIHSTNPGEGKSYNSTNLATILAMNNNKVLLIGADLRKPKLHKIFEVDNKHGLSTYLIGYDTFEEVIVPTQIENLSVLVAGPIPPNPAELLSKPALKELLDTARRQFDYVIIDNAPVALVTDGIMASRVSDLNVFVLRYGVSHKHQLEMINQLAESKKVCNIGLIVNDIRINSFGNTYYKYYQYEGYQNTYYTDEEKGKKTRKVKKRKSA